MSELLNSQKQFSKMFGKFLVTLEEQGYEITFGEVKRSQAQADANAKSGAGISNSLHLISLAADLNIFKDGKFLTTTTELEPVGKIWESLGGSWGGRFKKPDADHFSLSYQGVR